MASDWLWEQDSNLRFRFHRQPDNIVLRRGNHLCRKTRWELTDVDMTEERWIRHKADLDGRRPFRDFQYEFIGRMVSCIMW